MIEKVKCNIRVSPVRLNVSSQTGNDSFCSTLQLLEIHSRLKYCGCA